jgi:hypothetical protein
MRRLSLLVLPVLLLAACGGGSSLSKSEYVAQAEAICKDTNKQIDALSTPTDPASFQKLIEDSIKIADSATSRIKALDPPSDDKADLQKKVIEPLESQVKEARSYLAKVKEAVAKKDQPALGKLLTNPPTGNEADLDWMRSYGFKECVDAAKTDG